MDRAFKVHFVVIGSYALLVLLMTMPLAWFLDDYVIGAGGDPWQTMWRFEEKAAGGITLFAQDLLGQGEPRLVNLSVWPWVWAQYLFGQPLAYNLVWLLSFVLSGYGMYLLANLLLAKIPNSKSQIPNHIPAFLAGLAYMFWPYRVAHAAGHFGAMQTAWLPLIVFATVIFVRRPTVRRTIGLAGLLTIQAWSEHHYFLWLLLFGLLSAWFWSVYAKASTDKLELAKRWYYVVILAALLLLFVILPYWPTVQLALMKDSSLALGQEQTIRFSADLFSYLVPATNHPIWGGAVSHLFSQNFTGNLAETTHFLGLLPLLLVIFFVKSAEKRQVNFWLIVAVVFAAISLGPRLHIMGYVLPLPLPYSLIDDWPIFSSVRAVARAGVVVGLAWFVLFALVLKSQLNRSGAAWAIGVAILLEFLYFPVALIPTTLPIVYQLVADEPGTRLVDLPAATNYAAASRSLYATRRHGKEVVGNIAMERALTPSSFEEAKSLPVLRQLLFLRTTHLLEDRREFFEQESSETLPDVLKYMDVRQIVIQRDSLTANQLRAARHLLETNLGWYPELIDDELLYRVPDSVAGDGVFLARDDGWSYVGYDAKRGATFAQIQNSANLTLYNVSESERLVNLKFMVAPESDGALVIRRSEEIIWSPKEGAGPEVNLEISLPVGRTILQWSNQLPAPVVIQNPRLMSL